MENKLNKYLSRSPPGNTMFRDTSENLPFPFFWKGMTDEL